MAEQGKNTEARQSERVANQEASDKAEQGKNTEARQSKRAGIRERAAGRLLPSSHAAACGRNEGRQRREMYLSPSSFLNAGASCEPVRTSTFPTSTGPWSTFNAGA